MHSDAITHLGQHLEAAQQGLAASLKGITDSELHTAPEEDEWTVAEVCAHVIEMQPMWLQKIANAAEDPDLERSVAEIDRRTAAVDAHAGDDIDVVRRRLREANDVTLAVLRGIEPSTLATQTNRGTAEEAVRTLVIDHLWKHTEQVTFARVVVRQAAAHTGHSTRAG